MEVVKSYSVWGPGPNFEIYQEMASGNLRVNLIPYRDGSSFDFKEGLTFVARKLKSGRYRVTVRGFLVGQPPDKFEFERE